MFSYLLLLFSFPTLTVCFGPSLQIILKSNLSIEFLPDHQHFYLSVQHDFRFFSHLWLLPSSLITQQTFGSNVCIDTFKETIKVELKENGKGRVPSYQLDS